MQTDRQVIQTEAPFSVGECQLASRANQHLAYRHAIESGGDLAEDPAA